MNTSMPRLSGWFTPLRGMLGLGCLALIFLGPSTKAQDLGPAGSFFQGASAGVAVSFEYVSLPPVAVRLTARVTPTWAPTTQQLLEGNTVIKSLAEMRDVWNRLFAEPFDETQFDFATTFVVMMGGGRQSTASFDISSVEAFETSYNIPQWDFCGNPHNMALSVVGTTFLPGIVPDPLPPATYRLSAVKIPREHLDDIVFHRTTICGV